MNQGGFHCTAVDYRNKDQLTENIRWPSSFLRSNVERVTLSNPCFNMGVMALSLISCAYIFCHDLTSKSDTVLLGRSISMTEGRA
jgi:hypothetical protein